MAEPTPEEQAEAIAQSAEDGIKSVEVDGQKVEEHSLRDRIEAAKFAAARNRRGPGFKMVRIIPPGSV